MVEPDGHKYGPADLATLNAWTVEGRLQAGTMLEEEGTGRRLPAGSLIGLRFAPPIPNVGPVGAYPRAGATSYGGPPQIAPISTSYKGRNPNANFWSAIGLSLVALVLAWAIGYVGFVLSVGSIGLAWRSRVDDKHRLSWLALTVAVVSAILSVGLKIRREW